MDYSITETGLKFDRQPKLFTVSVLDLEDLRNKNASSLEEINHTNCKVDIEVMQKNSLILVIDFANKRYKIIKSRQMTIGIFSYSNEFDLFQLISNHLYY